MRASTASASMHACANKTRCRGAARKRSITSVTRGCDPQPSSVNPPELRVHETRRAAEHREQPVGGQHTEPQSALQLTPQLLLLASAAQPACLLASVNLPLVALLARDADPSRAPAANMFQAIGSPDRNTSCSTAQRRCSRPGWVQAIGWSGLGRHIPTH